MRKILDRNLSKKKFFITFLILIIYIILAEIVFRISNSKIVSGYYESEISQAFSKKEWREAKEVSKELLEVGARAYFKPGTILYLYKEFHKKLINTNKLGFRTKKITKKKKNEIRIVLAGDSILFSTYVADKHTISSLLEQKLKKQFPKKQISVYNLGVEGFDLQKMNAAINYSFNKIKPDFVFIIGVSGDINFGYLRGFVKYKPYTKKAKVDEKQFKHFLAKTQKKSIWQKSFLLNKIFKILDEKKGRKFIAQISKNKKSQKLTKTLKQNLKGSVAGFIEEIRREKTILNSKNISPILIVLPILDFKKEKTLFEKQNNKLLTLFFPAYNKFAKSFIFQIDKKLKDIKGLEVYNLKNLFSNNSSIIYYDSFHINPLGNKILTEKLFDIVKKKISQD